MLNRGRKQLKYQTKPRGANVLFGLIYKGEQGACAGCAPSKSAPEICHKAKLIDRMLCWITKVIVTTGRMRDQEQKYVSVLKL